MLKFAWIEMVVDSSNSPKIFYHERSKINLPNKFDWDY